MAKKTISRETGLNRAHLPAKARNARAQNLRQLREMESPGRAPDSFEEAVRDAKAPGKLSKKIKLPK